MRARGFKWRARGLKVLAAAAVGCLGAALGALAATPVRPPARPKQVQIAGSVTYTWHGDNARGCALENLCHISGALTVQLSGSGPAFSTHGSELLVMPATGTVRVLRSDPGAAPAECVDVVQIDPLEITLKPGAAGRYLATLRSPSASSGRCAGPLARDLASLSVTASRLPGRAGPAFDVRSSAPFGAGPFSGQVVASFTVRPQAPGQGGGSSSSSSSGASFPAPGKRLVEYASASYRITGAGGALMTSFSGAPEPLCEPLDACGVAGSISLTVSAYSKTLEISARRIVGRAATRRQALADLRAGRLALDGASLLSRAQAHVAETLTRSGTATCDDINLLPVSLVTLPPPGHPTGIVLLLGGQFSGPGDTSDPFRSYCQGPTSTDVIGGGAPSSQSAGAIARGTIPLRELGSREISVAVAGPGGFAGTGYSGTRTGALEFSLTLRGLRAGTRQERVP